MREELHLSKIWNPEKKTLKKNSHAVLAVYCVSIFPFSTYSLTNFILCNENWKSIGKKSTSILFSHSTRNIVFLVGMN